MVNVFSEIAWLSVLAAFVPYFLLGALWFTLLFPTPYKVSLGRENNMPAKPAPIFIIGPAICCLVITIASAVLMYMLKIDSYEGALSFALTVGIGYLVANTVNIAINPNIPRPLLYGLISGAYHLVGIVIVCLILVALK
ncbi:DUF1761 domain-containing protein [Dyadobacter sp. CY343]|uniref:DUF1761 domain-containing protein n=1 Tax=Dyadobacter sp. CY343 TaxID=2907299 RepID=UPI001F1E5A9C|nr:DUF1761 domain-containing protein [Dyadobacter sp. CY343]MCE7062131.1 DUF1761 domain-containing protein [Dyadobacter sp. CY343]